jgi:hypothetical protein
MTKGEIVVSIIVAICLTLCVGIVGGLTFLNADHKRDLMQKCLQTERNAQDCHNAVYGFSR